MKNLNTIIQKIENIVEVKGNPNVKIEDISYDSRKIKENSLFVAIDGIALDGHDFIDECVKKGAIAVVGEKDIQKNDCIYIKVKDSRIALANISKEFYSSINKKIKIIGVTGTNGKTTTTHLIKSILENKGYKVGLIGTINYIIGKKVIQANRTTPESLELFKLFNEMYGRGITHIVMEVSSHSIALKRVHGLEFDTGVFTNLSQDHLDFHNSFDDYYESKKKLFEISSNKIINLDDFYGKRIVNEFNSSFITYGIDNGYIKAKNLKIDREGVNFNLCIDDVFKCKIRINIPGKFSVYNALAAIATSIIQGIDLESIKSSLILVKGVPGRFETVSLGQDFTVIVDYAHTPDSLSNILKAVKEFAKKRIILVFGCGGNRDKTKRAIMGEIASKSSDLIIITSDNPRDEEPDKIINEINKGIKKLNNECIKIIDRREAIKHAIESAEKDDVIVIAGKGHETYQEIKGKIYTFDDREVARDYIRRRL